jgi:uncharacterized protein YicC (UPF0701 family)
VTELAKAAADVARGAPGARALSVGEILRWPGVLAEPTVAPEALARACPPTRRTRPSPSFRHRARGRREARAMLIERCAAIEREVARVAPRIPALQAAYADKLGTRLKEAGLDPDGDRLKQELALFATKVDVAENSRDFAPI